MRELYYSRHGQTVDLSTGRRSRRTTVLTEQGWAEARQAGELLVARRIRPSLIVCSELPRAVQSAEAVAAVVGYDEERILREPLLNERLWGEAEGVPNAQIKQRWPGGFDTVPGAETVEGLQERAAQAAKLLKRFDVDVVLVVGHGTIGRAILRDFEGRPHTDEYTSERGALDNGQIIRLYPQPTVTLEL